MRAVILCLCLVGGRLGAADAPSEKAAGPSTASLKPLLGTWTYAGGEAEKAKLEAAIKQSTAKMIGGDIAADSLRSRAGPRSQLTLQLKGQEVRINSPGEPPEAGMLDGPAVPLTNRFGDKSQTTFKLEGAKLVEHGTSDKGSGSTTFAAGKNGELRVTRRIQSDKLAAPLEVTYTYRRKH